MTDISLLGIFSAMAMSISIIFLSILDSIKKKKSSKRDLGGKVTYFLDSSESEKRCSICLGRLGTGLIAVCGCGKISHDQCSSLTEMCPYCESPYEQMTVRPAVRAECPTCRLPLENSVCSCGMVLPRSDGTILCSCGNTVDCSRPLCGRCGTLYEKTVKYPAEGRKHKTRAGD